MPAFLARALAVLYMLHGGVGLAEPWKRARPGASTERQVLGLFGEPTSRRMRGGEHVLTYEEEQAPAGTLRADFRVEARTGRLRRIDVFPALVPSRGAVERMFGPACASASRARQPCYQVKLSPLNEPYLHYASRGVAVFFARGEVRSFAYLPPARGRRGLDSAVEPPEGLADAAPVDSPPGDSGETEPPRVDAGATATRAAAPDRTEREAARLLALARVGPATPSAPQTTPEVAVTGTALAASAPEASELRPAMMEGPGAPEVTPTASALEASELRPAMMEGPSPEATSARERVPVPRPPNELEEGAASSKQTDVLALGGFYFQRADLSLSRRAADDTATAQPFFPGLLDVYLDFRPQEGLRGYVVGRLLYDPLDPTFSTPRTNLDKLWLYFGLFDHVFVTAGRQHVKWGSSRVWNTTDFLRNPNPDPLGVFDLRQGVDMVKVNVPFESLASNLWFFATADVEDTPQGAASQIRYGGAVRAEVTLGTSELIATASFLERRRPRYGLDYSLGLGPLDLNAEVALLRDSDQRLWRREGDGFAERPAEGTKVRASGGVAVQLRVADIYRVIARLEGFYNQLGDSDRGLLTWVQSTGDYQPLFFGRVYGLTQVSIARRSVNEPTLTFSVLGNVSDPSFLGRVDFGFQHKEVFFASFVEAPFGERGGEFRFQPDPSVADLPATDLGLFRVGLNLRFKL